MKGPKLLKLVAGSAVFVAAMALSANFADASMTFGYQQNSSPTFGQLHLDTTTGVGSTIYDVAGGTQVDFTADDGGSVGLKTYSKTTMDVNAEVTSVNSFSGYTFYGLKGSVTFTSNGGATGDLLTIDFPAGGPIALVQTSSNKVGTLQWASGSGGPAVTFTAGSLLASDFSITSLLGESFSFAPTNSKVTGNGITFNTGFSSTAFEVPEPGSLALVSLGVIGLIRRRRTAAA